MAIILILIFCLELLILFFLSRKITQKLAGKLSIRELALLFLPGTIIHELSHVLSAGVLLVHVGEVEFMPQQTPEGIKLGSAQIGQTDFIRRAIIGFAPVLLGLSIILGISFYFIANFDGPWWAVIILLFILFEVGNTMFSSKKDMEGTAAFLVIFSSLLVAFYFLGFHEPLIWVGEQIQKTSFFWQKIDLLMTLPIALDLGLFGILTLVKKI